MKESEQPFKPALKEASSNHKLSSVSSLQSDCKDTPLHDDSLEDLIRPIISPTKAILIVDDVDINRAVSNLIVEEMGLVACTAGDGQEAITQMLERSDIVFSLVFMDCQMPGMDGYEATQKIRAGFAGEGYKQVPIIALTASAWASVQEKCLFAGMNDFLSKPIDVEAFQAKVKQWLFPEKLNPATSDTTDSPISSPVGNNAAITDLAMIWDEDTLMTRVRQRRERAIKLISVFCDLLPSRLNELQSAADMGDNSHMFQVAHSLKGSAGSIGANQLSAISGKIELAAKGNDLDRAKALIPKLLEAKAILLNVLVAVLNERT